MSALNGYGKPEQVKSEIIDKFNFFLKELDKRIYEENVIKAIMINIKGLDKEMAKEVIDRKLDAMIAKYSNIENLSIRELEKHIDSIFGH